MSPSLQLIDPIHGRIAQDPKFSESWIPVRVIISQSLHVDGLRGRPNLVRGRIYVVVKPTQ